jgi:hypothetical protein
MDNAAIDHSGLMSDLLKDARYKFGNPNAGRKTAWENETPQKRDEL